MPELVIKHPYHGIEIPAETPFQPVVEDYGELAKVRFNDGYVYDWANSNGGKPTKWEVNGINQDYDADGEFFIKIVREKNSEGDFVVVSVDLVTNFAATEDEDSRQTRAFLLCELEKGSLKESGVREDIHTFSGGGEIIIHQWKINKTDDMEVYVAGGVVTDSNEIHNVNGESLNVSGGDYILLEISRSSGSRNIASVYITSGSSVTESTSSTQYIPLGQIEAENGEISNITQLKFEEVHIFESLAIVNGEFKLVDLLMAGRNYYGITESE